MAVATTNLGTYSPEDFVIVISNPDFTHQVSGYVEGTFIDIERQVPASTGVVGADLTAGRVIRDNRYSIVTLSLMQTSQSIDVLSHLLERDTRLRNDDGLFSILIKDTLGRSVWFSDQAFIGVDGNASFSTDIEGRDWVIECFNLKSTQGGNARFDADTVAAIEALGGTVEQKWQPR